MNISRNSFLYEMAIVEKEENIRIQKKKIF